MIFAFLPAGSIGANPGNLVANGDFTGGSLNNWSTWGDIRMYEDAAGIYSNMGSNSGIRQAINTSEKNLIFSCEISPRYGSNSGVQIAFNIYKNGSQLGQAFGYFNSLTPMQWNSVSFKVSDYWSQHTGAAYADFDQIEIIAETYNGCVAFFDNFKLEPVPGSGTTIEVSKSAEGSGEGYLTWNIEKSVSNNTYNLAVNETAVASYTVAVEPVYHETGITVSGKINIKNTGTPGEAASVTYVKDKVEYKAGDGPWTEVTTVNVSGPLTVAVGGAADIPYSISFAPIEGATEYRNTAFAGLANCSLTGGGTGFQEFTCIAGISKSGGTITSDAFADVSDSVKGSLGEAWAGDPATCKYSYDMTIGPFASPGDYKVDNTATVKGKDSQATTTDSESISVHVTGKGKIKVTKELKAPDGLSKILIPDNSKFKITLQKSVSSGWENVETRTITAGASQEFDAATGFKYRVIEEETENYVQLTNTGPVLLEKNGQSLEIKLEGRQKFAVVKVTADVVDSGGGDIADEHTFWIKLKGGSRTMYQPLNERFPTFFLVWPGTYTASSFKDNGYLPVKNLEPFTAGSNGQYTFEAVFQKNTQ